METVLELIIVINRENNKTLDISHNINSDSGLEHLGAIEMAISHLDKIKKSLLTK